MRRDDGALPALMRVAPQAHGCAGAAGTASGRGPAHAPRVVDDKDIGAKRGPGEQRRREEIRVELPARALRRRRRHRTVALEVGPAKIARTDGTVKLDWEHQVGTRVVENEVYTHAQHQLEHARKAYASYAKRYASMKCMELPPQDRSGGVTC